MIKLTDILNGIKTEGLKEMGITDFKSLFIKMPSDLQKRVYNLKNFGQRLDKHPEGNVLKHTIMVVNRSIKDDDIDIAIAAMFHDIGKDVTAGIHPKKGHITHFGHEKVSANLVKKYKDWIQSVGGNPANVYYIVKNHMKYKQLDNMGIKKVMKLKAFRAFDKLGKFSKHDRGGLSELYSNPICPRKEGESDEEYKQRCAPLMGPSVLMNIPSLGEDKIPGGLAGGMGLTDIAKHHNVSVDVLVDEFKKGISVEMEHTSDREIAKEIALDHLYEDPKYYTKLSSIEERSKGKLRPADKLRRKRAMAGKKAAIQRRKLRTQKRKKPLDKLKKIAYKQAYLQVYKQFMNDLFPGMKKSDLSIQQAKIVHKNVLRKKGRVLKRAKFKFLPALRAKEAEKFKKD
jgi:hypothetical protein